MPVTWINLPLNVELSAMLDELVYECNKVYLSRVAAAAPDDGHAPRRPTRLSVALALLHHGLHNDAKNMPPEAKAAILMAAPAPERPDLKRAFNGDVSAAATKSSSRRPRRRAAA